MRINGMKKRFFQTIALILSISLAFPASLKAAPIPSSIPEVVIPILANQIEIPESIGKIQDRYLPSSSANENAVAPLILHIQDAHTSYEAQKNIQKILAHLKTEYGFDLIFLEGSMGKAEPQLLKFFKSDAINLEMADRLAKDGVIGGSELFIFDEMITGKASPAEIFGIENPELYRQDLSAFRSVMSAREKTDDFLAQAKTQILSMGSRVFNKKLQNFFREWLFYQNNQAELMRHLQTLQKSAEENLGLTLTDPKNQLDWPQLTRFFKLKEIEKDLNPETAAGEKEKIISWMKENGFTQEKIADMNALDSRRPFHPKTSGSPREFFELFFDEAAPRGFKFENFLNARLLAGQAILQSELNASDLMTEVETLNQQILDHIAVSADEKALIQIYQNCGMLNKLLSLELVSSQYESVLADMEPFKPASLAARLTAMANPSEEKNIRLLASSAADISPVFDEALRFYQGARARDTAFITNTLEKMISLKKPKAVLITGGFHAAPLQERFKSMGISFLEIAPQISAIADSKSYNDVMTLHGDFSVQKSYARQPTAMNRLDALASNISPETARFYLQTIHANVAAMVKTLSARGQTLAGLITEINQSPGAQAQGLSYKTTPDGIGILSINGNYNLRVPAKSGYAGLSNQGSVIIPADAALRDYFDSLANPEVTGALKRSEIRETELPEYLRNFSERFRALTPLPPAPLSSFEKEKLEAALETFKTMVDGPLKEIQRLLRRSTPESGNTFLVIADMDLGIFLTETLPEARAARVSRLGSFLYKRADIREAMRQQDSKLALLLEQIEASLAPLQTKLGVKNSAIAPYGNSALNTVPAANPYSVHTIPTGVLQRSEVRSAENNPLDDVTARLLANIKPEAPLSNTLKGSVDSALANFRSSVIPEIENIRGILGRSTAESRQADLEQARALLETFLTNTLPAALTARAAALGSLTDRKDVTSQLGAQDRELAQLLTALEQNWSAPQQQLQPVEKPAPSLTAAPQSSLPWKWLAGAGAFVLIAVAIASLNFRQAPAEKEIAAVVPAVEKAAPKEIEPVKVPEKVIPEKKEEAAPIAPVVEAAPPLYSEEQTKKIWGSQTPRKLSDFKGPAQLAPVLPKLTGEQIRYMIYMDGRSKQLFSPDTPEQPIRHAPADREWTARELAEFQDTKEAIKSFNDFLKSGRLIMLKKYREAYEEHAFQSRTKGTPQMGIWQFMEKMEKDKSPFETPVQREKRLQLASQGWTDKDWYYNFFRNYFVINNVHGKAGAQRIERLLENMEYYAAVGHGKGRYDINVVGLNHKNHPASFYQWIEDSMNSDERDLYNNLTGVAFGPVLARAWWDMQMELHYDIRFKTIDRRGDFRGVYQWTLMERVYSMRELGLGKEAQEKADLDVAYELTNRFGAETNKKLERMRNMGIFAPEVDGYTPGYGLPPLSRQQMQNLVSLSAAYDFSSPWVPQVMGADGGFFYLNDAKWPMERALSVTGTTRAANFPAPKAYSLRSNIIDAINKKLAEPTTPTAPPGYRLKVPLTIREDHFHPILQGGAYNQASQAPEDIVANIFLYHLISNPFLWEKAPSGRLQTLDNVFSKSRMREIAQIPEEFYPTARKLLVSDYGPEMMDYIDYLLTQIDDRQTGKGTEKFQAAVKALPSYYPNYPADQQVPIQLSYLRYKAGQERKVSPFNQNVLEEQLRSDFIQNSRQIYFSTPIAIWTSALKNGATTDEEIRNFFDLLVEVRPLVEKDLGRKLRLVNWTTGDSGRLTATIAPIFRRKIDADLGYAFIVMTSKEDFRGEALSVWNAITGDNLKTFDMKSDDNKTAVYNGFLSGYGTMIKTPEQAAKFREILNDEKKTKKLVEFASRFRHATSGKTAPLFTQADLKNIEQRDKRQGAVLSLAISFFNSPKSWEEWSAVEERTLQLLEASMTQESGRLEPFPRLPAALAQGVRTFTDSKNPLQELSDRTGIDGKKQIENYLEQLNAWIKTSSMPGMTQQDAVAIGLLIDSQERDLSKEQIPLLDRSALSSVEIIQKEFRAPESSFLSEERLKERNEILAKDGMRALRDSDPIAFAEAVLSERIKTASYEIENLRIRFKENTPQWRIHVETALDQRAEMVSTLNDLREYQRTMDAYLASHVAETEQLLASARSEVRYSMTALEEAAHKQDLENLGIQQSLQAVVAIAIAARGILDTRMSRNRDFAQFLISRTGLSEEQAPEIAPEQLNAEIGSRTAFLSALFTDPQLRKKLNLPDQPAASIARQGLVVLTTSGKTPGDVNLLRTALPFFASREDAAQRSPGFIFAGDPAVTLALKNALLGGKNNLGSSAEQRSQVSRIFKFDTTHGNLDEAITAAVQSRAQHFLVASARPEEADGAAGQILTALEDAGFSTADMNSASKLADLAESYYFRAKLLKDLAAEISQRKLTGETLKTELKKIVADFLRQNLPDYFSQVNIKSNGSFDLPLSLIHQQLEVFRAAYQQIQSAA